MCNTLNITPCVVTRLVLKWGNKTQTSSDSFNELPNWLRSQFNSFEWYIKIPYSLLSSRNGTRPTSWRRLFSHLWNVRLWWLPLSDTRTLRMTQSDPWKYLYLSSPYVRQNPNPISWTRDYLCSGYSKDPLVMTRIVLTTFLGSVKSRTNWGRYTLCYRYRDSGSLLILCDIRYIYLLMWSFTKDTYRNTIVNNITQL